MCGNVDEKVVNTLIRLRSSGLSEGTLRNLAFNLKHLAKFSDLDCPESVKDCISRKDCANSFKENLSKAYNYYAVACMCIPEFPFSSVLDLGRSF